jgi:hypothetical protein
LSRRRTTTAGLSTRSATTSRWSTSSRSSKARRLRPPTARPEATRSARHPPSVPTNSEGRSRRSLGTQGPRPLSRRSPTSTRLGGARQPANAESGAVQSSQIWPARHPPREAPKTAQKCDLKVVDRRWSATAVAGPVRCRCANAAAIRSAPGKGWKVNRSKPPVPAEAANSCPAGLSLSGGNATGTLSTVPRCSRKPQAGVPAAVRIGFAHRRILRR